MKYKSDELNGDGSDDNQAGAAELDIAEIFDTISTNEGEDFVLELIDGYHHEDCVSPS